jgi:hypothetical protein
MLWSPLTSGVMRRLGLTLVALVVGASAPAFAAEPSGCDKFAWPIAGEQRLLAVPQSVDLTGPLSRAMTTAIDVPLVAAANAKLAMPPERPPKNTGSFAGMVSFEPAATGGGLIVTLLAAAWIDVIQDGRYRKPTAFSGASDCPHVRKSVKFQIGSGAFIVQVSDVAANTIAIVLTPAD